MPCGSSSTNLRPPSARRLCCSNTHVESAHPSGKALGLSEDVAGASFTAVGSSSPELVLSFVDAFVTQASVGLGTVLGSAKFNLLVTVGGSIFRARARGTSCHEYVMRSARRP